LDSGTTREWTTFAVFDADAATWYHVLLLCAYAICTNKYSFGDIAQSIIFDFLYMQCAIEAMDLFSVRLAHLCF